MGDRISIRFVNKRKGMSVVLFSHWDGKELLKEAKNYLKQLPKGSHTTPLDRREPKTVMVDFIRHLTTGFSVVDSNYYLGVNENDGDNSDNGHYDIDVMTGKVKQ